MKDNLREREIDRNYDYFQSHFNEFARDHFGQFALIKASRVVGFFDHVAEATDAGDRLFPDRIYSVQVVEPDPVDLGFLSRV